MRRQDETVVIPIRGVTYEGRQANLERCYPGREATYKLLRRPERGIMHEVIPISTHHPGQPVQLTMQPDNKHDRNAVHITDLQGYSLGYVPRD